MNPSTDESYWIRRGFVNRSHPPTLAVAVWAVNDVLLVAVRTPEVIARSDTPLEQRTSRVSDHQLALAERSRIDWVTAAFLVASSASFSVYDLRSPPGLPHH